MSRPAWHDAALAASLARIPLVTRRVGSGVTEGRHASRLPGAGMEFAQYRGYQPGDDPRRVDWKLLARSDRLFVREADAETALPVRLVLDATGSMAHEEGGVVKFDAARAVVAALAEAAVRNGDIPSLGILGDEQVIVPPSRDTRQVERIIHALEHARAHGSTSSMASLVDGFVRGSDGIVVVVTDWHDPADSIRPALERTGIDTTLIVLRTPREHDIQYGRPLVLEDLESGERVTVDGGLADGRAQVIAARIAAARRAGIDVVMVDPLQPLASRLAAWLAERAGRR